MRKKSEHDIKFTNHKVREQEKKKETEKNYQCNQKTSSKMAISTYLSIITLNANGLHSPIKIHRVAKYTQNTKNHLHVAYTSKCSLTSDQRNTRTESEETEKEIPCKWKTKESWYSFTYIRQNGL